MAMANQEEVAHLAWVIQKEMLYQCMALHPVSK